MIINSVRFKAKKSNDWSTFRLSQGFGGFKNFTCLRADKSQLQKIQKAIRFALTGEVDCEIASTTVQLNDDAGNAWTIQRTPRQVRILKNNKILQRNADNKLRRALLDLDAMDKIPDSQSTVDIFSIDARENGLEIAPIREEVEVDASAKALVERQINAISKKCEDIFDEPKMSNPLAVVGLVEKIEPLIHKYLGVCSQSRLITGDVAEISKVDLGRIDKLGEELKILEQIEVRAIPLLKPGTNLRGLKEARQKVDRQLAKIKNSIGANIPDIDFQSVAWQAPLEIKCRLEMYEKLLGAASNVRGFYEKGFNSVYDEFVEIAETSFSNDAKVLAELESCLDSINLRIKASDFSVERKSSAKSDDPSRVLKTWFDKFSTSFKENRDDSEERKVSRDLGTETPGEIESMRMSIGYAIGRLGELRSSVNSSRGRRDEAFIKIEETHESLVRECGRLRSEWVNVAKAQKLPENINTSQIQKLAMATSAIADLTCKREQLSVAINERRTRLSELTELLKKWRQVTGSQNASDISHPAILLTEARSVISYKREKERFYTRLKTQKERVDAFSGVCEELDSKKAAIVSEWNEVFTQTGLRPIRIDHAELSDLVKSSRLIESLGSMIGLSRKEEPHSSLNQLSACAPIRLFVCSVPANALESRKKLAEQLSKATPDGWNLVLVTNMSVAKELVELGLGKSAEVLKKAEAVVTPAPAKTKPSARATLPKRPSAKKPTKKKSEEIVPVMFAKEPKVKSNVIGKISPRAQAALDVLTTKRK